MDFRSLPFALDENPDYSHNEAYEGRVWYDPDTGDKYRCCYVATAITSTVGGKAAAFVSGNNTRVEVSSGAEALTAGAFASGLTTVAASSLVWVQTEGIIAASCSTTGSIAAKALMGIGTGGSWEALAATGSNAGIVQAHALLASGTGSSTVTTKLRAID